MKAEKKNSGTKITVVWKYNLPSLLKKKKKNEQRKKDRKHWRKVSSMTYWTSKGNEHKVQSRIWSHDIRHHIKVHQSYN